MGFQVYMLCEYYTSCSKAFWHQYIFSINFWHLQMRLETCMSTSKAIIPHYWTCFTSVIIQHSSTGSSLAAFDLNKIRDHVPVQAKFQDQIITNLMRDAFCKASANTGCCILSWKHVLNSTTYAPRNDYLPWTGGKSTIIFTQHSICRSWSNFVPSLRNIFVIYFTLLTILWSFN